jgi:hypothetical protein
MGIEIDVRDNGHDLELVHDPFSRGELMVDFLSNYQLEGTMIVNIKSERIEERIITLLNRYSINNYFFLDSSVPMIISLSNSGFYQQAARYSEFEALETILKLKDKIEWVWVDCFSHFPLSKKVFDTIKSCNLKICIVSPELQSQPEKIEVYKDYILLQDIVPDAICSKVQNVDRWKGVVDEKFYSK